MTIKGLRLLGGVVALLTIPLHGWSQFIEVTSDFALSSGHTGGYLGHGLSLADFSGDQIDDLTVVDWQGNIYTYLGNGVGFDPIFLEIDEGEDLEPKCVLWADIDNDGDKDLFITYRLSPNRLWINHGGLMFEEVSATCGISQGDRRSYGACFGDYDADGYLDLFVANYNWVTDVPGNELYHNNGDGTFTSVTVAAGLDGNFIQNFQGHWVDFNEDGLLDLFVIVDRIIYPNLYYVNQGDGTFVESAAEYGLDFMVNAMSTSVADFDGDNDMDVYVSGAMFDNNRLMVNDGEGSFDLYDPALGDALHVNELSWGANWLDYDNDMNEDLYVNTGFSTYTEFPQVFSQYPDVPQKFYRNSDDGGFADAYLMLPSDDQLSFASSVADWNNDGFPDIASNQVGEVVLMLENAGIGGHYIKVLPVGTISNRDGVGTKFRAWVNGEVNYQMSFCGENYMGQNSSWEFFGLGEASAVDSLVVTWPSGIVDTYFDLPVDSAYVVTEGETTEVENPCEGEGLSCLGCMYEVACNYSPDALMDDGTCDFTCLYDNTVCGPGTFWDPVTSQCLQIPMYDPCPSDINMDGAVTMADLLLMLVNFGTYCQE